MKQQALIATLKDSLNIYVNMLFGLAVLNLVRSDFLNAGVWLSIAVGALAHEAQMKTNSECHDELWSKAKLISVSFASLFVCLMILGCENS